MTVGVSKILTNDHGSAGIDKQDRRQVGNLDVETSAGEWNVVKQAVVELTASVGLENGTTPGSIVELLSRFVLDVSKARTFLWRDDMVPVEPKTYVNAKGVWADDTLVVADAGGDGYGVRMLEVDIGDALEATAAFVSGGQDGLIVRTRFRITNGVIEQVNIGLGDPAGTTDSFYISLGFNTAVHATNISAFFSDSVTANGIVALDSGITLVEDTWYELELQMDYVQGDARFYVDGVLSASAPADNSKMPDATEDMGAFYQIDTAANNGRVEIDYIEVEGVRW